MEAASPFRCNHYRDVSFSGDIRLGTTENQVLRNGKIPMDTGIYNAVIHNCTIGNDVFINRVGNYIADYDIADNVMIENVGSISMSGESAFGNGVEVSVLNETGGREVPIYDCLSAHIAYIIAMYRHDKLLISRLRELISGYVASKRSSTGTIARNVTIINTGTVTDVSIGEYATIEGATRLTNGSIVSEQADPVFVGPNVMAEDFIMSAGAHVSEGAVLVHTFVGQATSLTRLFSAHDSLFFANCACENGESAAIFAGPYTVTMHKSSLLIAGMFSFLNAGSGSNQSNHMYKLGPVHWGILERGVKTSSDSYLMLGAKIGAFSMLMGQHKTHPDSSQFPFSYLFGDEKGATVVVPGVMLRSCGLMRDEKKWPARDRRLKRRLPIHDRIVFDVLNPLTVEKMLSASDVIDALLNKPADDDRYVRYRGMKFTRASLERAKFLYTLGIYKYLDLHIDETGFPYREPGHISAEWVDIAGLPVPRTCLERVKRAESIEEIERVFDEAFNHYRNLERAWIASRFDDRWRKPKAVISEFASQFDKMVEEDRARYLEDLAAQNAMLAL